MGIEDKPRHKLNETCVKIHFRQYYSSHIVFSITDNGIQRELHETDTQ
jgi:hypothetical protein